MKVALVSCAVVPGVNVETGKWMAETLIESARESYNDIRTYIVLQGKEIEDQLLGRLNDETTFVFNKSNIGQPKGLNLGIRLALQHGADLVLCCDDDVRFEGDAISRLIDTYKSLHNPGMIGPITNNIEYQMHGQVQHGPQFKRAEVAQVPRLNGFCFLISKQVVEELWGIDERFPSTAGWDDDLCFRAKIHGYRLYLDHGAFVWHRRQVTVLALRYAHPMALDYAHMLIRNRYHVQWVDPIGSGALYQALDLKDQDRQKLKKILQAVDPVLEDYSAVEDYLIDHIDRAPTP